MKVRTAQQVDPAIELRARVNAAVASGCRSWRGRWRFGAHRLPESDSPVAARRSRRGLQLPNLKDRRNGSGDNGQIGGRHGFNFRLEPVLGYCPDLVDHGHSGLPLAGDGDGDWRVRFGCRGEGNHYHSSAKCQSSISLYSG